MTPGQSGEAPANAPDDVEWRADASTLAAWDGLQPGRSLTIAKHDPHGAEVTRYPGRVVSTRQVESWVELEAWWTNKSVTVHGLRFATGDRLLERFSPLLPFNVFAVLSPAGQLRGWYANVTHPARLDAVGDETLLIWHDLYLDLVAFPDGSFLAVDDDELEAAGLATTDTRLHTRIVAARDELIRRFQSRQFPF